MRATILRILKNGIPTAIALALLGYMMGGLAGMWFESNQTPRTVNGTHASNEMAGAGNDITQQLRARLPFTMAAWGFALVTVFELIALVWRGPHAVSQSSPIAKSTLNPTNDLDPEVEQLLNQLLEQADAARAAQVNLPVESRESATVVG